MTAVGVTGHQGLPPAATALVQSRLPAILAEVGASELVGSLAEGADQLCATIAADLGVSLRVILPSKMYDSTFDGEALATYNRLLSGATSVITLPYDAPSEAAFLAAGHRVADEADVLIAVWDGKPAAGVGGTGDVVDYARDRGASVLVLWPEGVER